MNKAELAARLIRECEIALGDRSQTLETRIREVLKYMDDIKTPNLHTLEHIKRYLVGEYDNGLS